MKLAHLSALTVAATLCMTQVAVAQFEWLDHNGRHVFSDQMPPADIPEENILKEPQAGASMERNRMASAASTADEGEATAEPAEGAGDGGTDAELEQKKQEIEAAEQERLAAQEKQQQAARAENCERAQRGKRALESGMRMARINEAGERVVIDDAQRATELQRANEIIDANC